MENPLTPGAARITTEAVSGSAEDMEAYVDQNRLSLKDCFPG